MIQGVILAGGMGTRLKAVLQDLPKPMAPVRGRPFLEYQLLALKSSAIDRLVICVGYRGQAICDYFGDGSKWGVQIDYSTEPTPLGTAGALKNAGHLLETEFLALNGDTLVRFDYSQLLEHHRARGAKATIALVSPEEGGAPGNVVLNQASQVTFFGDLQVVQRTAHQWWINAGMYILDRSLLVHIPEGRPVSLEQETFPLLVSQGVPVYGLVTSGYFVDIGTPEDYRRFERDIVEGRVYVDQV